MMPTFDLIDEAVIDADIITLFNAVLDANNYSKWWMPRVQAKIRGEEKVLQKGSVYDIEVHRGIISTFGVRVTDIEVNKSIKLEYFEGDFIGPCEYTFESINGKTRIRYQCNLRTNRFLITLISLISKSIQKAHSEVMQLGFTGLNNYLAQMQEH